jgi:glycosyltransferase involved in cell wall biosynthesis
VNIAILGPSPVPFVMGGVENLLTGLQHHINQLTAHHCELIKLPSPERDFWEVLGSYERFFRLDLSHFDRVITTKYPAWMVRHKHQICYVQHRLRGLYDSYGFCGEPTAFAHADPAVKRVLEVVENPGLRGTDGLERAFEALAALRDRATDVPVEVFKFPGPFIRKILHFLDDRAMADGGVKRFLAISRTVADRKEYFPAGAQVTAVHHPSFLPTAPAGQAPGKPYFFTASRLDGPKRIGLLVDAMRAIDADVTLMIAGSGPQEAELRQQAAGDPRIAFLGYTPDDQLADLYAGALAVLFVPYQEDYGLITIEAMRAGKPVLTCVDSGGSNEFVADGETGFSVLPDPAALAEKLRFLAANPAEAEAMAPRCRERAAAITWERTIAALLGPEAETAISVVAPASQPRRRTEPRDKLVVTSTFGVYPPRGGGQNRLYYLYRALADRYDVEIVSVAPAGDPPFQGEIAPGVTETRVPKSRRHQDAESVLERQVGVPVTDVAMPRLIGLTPDYEAALRKAVQGARWLVASHPYLLPAIEAVRDGQRLIYEAHNVELDLKEPQLSGTRGGRDLLALVRDVEGRAARAADLVLTCSEEDARRLATLYADGLGAKAEVVPNGVHLASVPFVPWSERQARKREAGLAGTVVALFIGAWHPPNIEAAGHILALAAQCPDAAFVLMGSVGAALEGRRLPQNVTLTGVVDDALKAFMLGCADVALNPMCSGSGTNLKMLDYFAAGVPVISTPFGARGLRVQDGEHALLVTIEELADAISGLSRCDLPALTLRARAHAEAQFTWDVSANSLARRLTGDLVPA